MNNELKIFKNKEFGNLRVSEKDGLPYVCLADVCKILALEQVSRVKSRLNQNGVITSKVIDKLGRKQDATFINESNLYKVIFQSRKPEAEKFTEWVTSEVLPEIRKNGKYEIDTADTMQKLAESQLILNNVLSGFKVQIDNNFKQTNKKLSEHDELLRRRVYLSPKEAKDVQVAIRERAQQIAIQCNLQYQTAKGKLFKRLYETLNSLFGVATYRELPSVKYEQIIKKIKNLRIYVKDIQEEGHQ